MPESSAYRVHGPREVFNILHCIVRDPCSGVGQQPASTLAGLHFIAFACLILPAVIKVLAAAK